MIKARRIGYVALSTPDLSRQVDYYQSVVGLTLIDQSASFAVFAAANAMEAVVLEKGDKAGVIGLSFVTSPNIALTDMAAAFRAMSIGAEIQPGRALASQAVFISDPHGLRIELSNEPSFFKDQIVDRAISPLKLGHVALTTTDLERSTAFYENVLGFSLSDWREGRAKFLRCGPDHHTINVFSGAVDAVHHIAFEVRDWGHLARAADVLLSNGLPLDWGPGRHNIGHNVACYHRNPDEVRIEFYAEMDQMKDEELGYFEPRPWHYDRPQRPKAWPQDVKRGYWIPNAP